MTRKVRTKPGVEWVTFTPADARNALGVNDRNRLLRKGMIELYARDMLNGAWQPTGDTIKFSDTGRLLDGQHRLAAVVAAGEVDPDFTVLFLVAYGIPDAAQDVMDTGRRRSTGDMLQLHGVRNSTTVAASARLVFRIERGDKFTTSRGGGRHSVTASDILAWLEQNPEFEPFVAARMNDVTQGAYLALRPSALVATWWILSRLDPFEAERFFVALRDLDGLEPGSPVLALHKTVTRVGYEQHRVESEMWVSIVFEAWRDHVLGKSRSARYKTINRPWIVPVDPAEVRAGMLPTDDGEEGSDDGVA